MLCGRTFKSMSKICKDEVSYDWCRVCDVFQPRLNKYLAGDFVIYFPNNIIQNTQVNNFVR